LSVGGKATKWGTALGELGHEKRVNEKKTLFKKKRVSDGWGVREDWSKSGHREPPRGKKFLENEHLTLATAEGS